MHLIILLPSQPSILAIRDPSPISALHVCNLCSFSSLSLSYKSFVILLASQLSTSATSDLCKPCSRCEPAPRSCLQAQLCQQAISFTFISDSCSWRHTSRQKHTIHSNPSPPEVCRASLSSEEVRGIAVSKFVLVSDQVISIIHTPINADFILLLT